MLRKMVVYLNTLNEEVKLPNVIFTKLCLYIVVYLCIIFVSMHSIFALTG